MKRIKINKHEIGLVIKDRAYVRILKEGKYWIFNEEVSIFNRFSEFTLDLWIDQLMLVDGFREEVEMVDVPLNHLALVFVDQKLTYVYTAGKHAVWKSNLPVRVQYESIADYHIGESVERELLNVVPLKNYIRELDIAAHEKAVLLVDGKMMGLLDAGIYTYWKNINKIEVKRVDMRVRNIELTGQELLTKDKAQIRMNFVAQYQVRDVEKALLENSDYERQLYVMLQIALRNYIGLQSLDELMLSKDQVSEAVNASMASTGAMLGIELLHSGCKDLILPGEIRDIMNQVLVAEKKAQANVITRREETASTRSLLNTAKLLEENAMLYKLKELEYVERMAEKISEVSLNGNGQLLDQLKTLFVK
ncbi:slipin family protein [Gynurincola endophyticus]|uniref:slipin family protein n=1 Tax=Gynurincola endophyticus TaxID=2479004 RepID=UPI000F8F4D4B|nr:slipin family protein [Gynurincola endophyticus]